MIFIRDNSTYFFIITYVVAAHKNRHKKVFYEEIAKFIFQFLSNIKYALYLFFLLLPYMSLAMRKTGFGVFDQVPYKSGCAATEDG